jgi:hypothetical protein
VRDIIKTLNPVLLGWAGYFRTGNASDELRERGPLRRMAAEALLINARVGT